MTRPRFSQSFTQQLAIPDEGIEAANVVMRSGPLHRHSTKADDVSETAKLEREYADWQGSAFCLAVASGGQAMQIALRAAGVVPGDLVLTNGFTLASVPGAIAAVGGLAFLVEITRDLVICLDDAARVIERPAAVGVKVMWFGATQPAGFTSDHHSWRYVVKQDLPKTDAILAGLFDMRLSLTFSLENCMLVSDHILDAVDAVAVKERA